MLPPWKLRKMLECIRNIRQFEQPWIHTVAKLHLGYKKSTLNFKNFWTNFWCLSQCEGRHKALKRQLWWIWLMVCDEEPDEERKVWLMIGAFSDIPSHIPLILGFLGDQVADVWRDCYCGFQSWSCDACMWRKAVIAWRKPCMDTYTWLFYYSASCSRCIGCQCWVDRNSISYQLTTRLSVFHVPCQLAITKSCFSGHTICRTLCALLLYFLLSIIQLIIIAGIEICSRVLKNSPKKYPFTKIDEF